ncbi:unnamed protein product [Brachionus calyciflorus]|uniref:Nucleolar protein 16 n=1 Tax=Brachionus calyciflorus TaxID=104777 RepID=A0A813SI70_9BILA|nr:unnamed protein product [Brachionus calyciflorus]
MVKKVRKFNYNKDLKKKWKKTKAKENPVVKTEHLKDFWNSKKSIKANYAEMGLCSDPNFTLGIPKTKNILNPEFMEIEKAKQLDQALNESKKETPALKKLIAEANRPVEKVYNLNENDILYCIYMMEKYSEDYAKMAKDYKNYYQDTPAQIRKKINLFKQMKGPYQKYLSDKKAGVDFLDKLDEKY